MCAILSTDGFNFCIVPKYIIIILSTQKAK